MEGLLVNLLVPVEHLLSPDVAAETEIGRITSFEVNSFLVRSKVSFRDARVTKAVLDFIKSASNLESQRKLNDEACNAINNCLILLRNILNIPEARNVHYTIHNQIIWNLFVQNLDKVLIHLMTCEHRAFWGISLVQLIAVLYQDQHVGVLQKLLNVWFEGSISESSEDNESNTMPDQQSDSSPILTSSDPTSDSSETGSKGTLDDSSGVPHVLQRVVTTGCNGGAEVGKLTAKMLNIGESTGERKGLNNRPSAGSGKRNTDVVEPAEEQKSGSSAVGMRKSGNRRSSESGTFDTMSLSGDSSSSAYASLEGASSSNLASNSTGKGGFKSSASHHRNASLRTKSTIAGTQKRDLASQDFSDCGYASHAETPEAVSTSSNEDDVLPNKRHQKPHIQKTRYATKQQSPQEKKEVRRKKLIKRSKTTFLNIKAIANHVPTDDDITHILKEFTVDFLLKGYDPLISVLYEELLSPKAVQRVDSSHFFWLLTYFLKFALTLELDLDHVRQVLSYRVISYLVYENVRISENVESALKSNSPELKALLRRQHLAVTAIREFILCIDAYDKISYLNMEDKNSLQALRRQISCSNDLKCLFVLLLRQYKPDVHSKQYLSDLVVTNHIFLTFLENVGDSGNGVSQRLSISNLIQQFASSDVIKQYGLLLEDFQSNGEFVNDCVLTMMHHIGGEMNQVSSLCQPSILKTFTQIWESDLELCDDWSDLIEYVIHRFVNIPRHCPIVGSSPILPVVKNSQAEDSGWSKEECENLYWYFALSSSKSDLITSIIRLYEENGVIKTRIAVIERLLKQGVICQDQYNQLLEEESKKKQEASRFSFPELPSSANNCFKRQEETCRFPKPTHPVRTFMTSRIRRIASSPLARQEVNHPKMFTRKHSSTIVHSNSETIETQMDHQLDDEAASLREKLLLRDMGPHLLWLQRLLIETCFAKLLYEKSPTDVVDVNLLGPSFEPIPYYYTRLGESVPIVPWNADQAQTLRKKPFQDLLVKLGFSMPADNGSVFVRIPSSWTTEMLLTTAQKFSPIDTTLLKFDLTQVPGFTISTARPVKKQNSFRPLEHRYLSPRSRNYSSLIKCTPTPNLPRSWLNVVKLSKMKEITAKSTGEPLKHTIEAEDIECASVNSYGDNASSDLAYMCVSDEDAHF